MSTGTATAVNRTCATFSLRKILALTLVLRAFYSVFAAIAIRHIPVDPRLIASNDFTSTILKPADGLRFLLLGVWQRFDTLWYVHIAQNGYDLPASVVFYPLYPALIRLLTPLTRDPFLATLFISTVATFFMLWGLINLVALDYGDRVAFRAAVVYVCWPASFIFFAGYAEATLMALVIWSIYFGRCSKWYAAGVTGALAALTKAAGILVVVPLVIIAIRDRRGKSLLPLVPLFGLSFMLWLKATGRLLPSEAYPQFWGTHVAPPWTSLAHSFHLAFGGSNPTIVIHLALMFVLVAASLARKDRPEYPAYALAALVFFLTKDSVASQQQWGRYALILFPAMITFARVLRNRIDLGFLVVALSIVNLGLLWAFLGWSLVV
jgi:hypothetical protein